MLELSIITLVLIIALLYHFKSKEVSQLRVELSYAKVILRIKDRENELLKRGIIPCEKIE